MITAKDIGDVCIKAKPPDCIQSELAHADLMVSYASRHLCKAIEYIRRINPTNIEGTIELMKTIVSLQNQLQSIRVR